MKKALLILFLILLAVGGYWMFHLGIILFKVLIGIGIIIILFIGGVIGYAIGKSSN